MSKLALKTASPKNWQKELNKDSHKNERCLFGTDGIRGRANIYPMVPELVMLLGRAVTCYFQMKFRRNKKPLIIVGKDTRLSCYMLEQAFSAGVCAQGGQVIFTGPLPTPGVAFVTNNMRADAGVMISASHNQYSDNGIKIFDHKGQKLPDDAEFEIEKLVLNPELMTAMVDDTLGSAKRLQEVFGRYLVHVKAAVEENVELDGMRVVLDCANGAGYQVAPMMFRELGAEVFPLGVAPNGTNINLACGSLYPELAGEKVLKYRADLGICLDGDADRVVLIDTKGEIIDGDRLIGVAAKFLLEKGKIKKGSTIVGTVMSNLGLENYLKDLGLKFHRTQVGDRYILEYMKESGALLGGEPSGHIIFKAYSTTGDGILAALKIIEAMKFYNKKIDELASEIKLYPQELKNVTIHKKTPFEQVPAIKAILKKAQDELKDKGRVLLRYSGTEPLARVMVEGESAKNVATLAHEIAQVVEVELGVRV